MIKINFPHRRRLLSDRRLRGDWGRNDKHRSRDCCRCVIDTSLNRSIRCSSDSVCLVVFHIRNRKDNDGTGVKLMGKFRLNVRAFKFVWSSICFQFSPPTDNIIEVVDCRRCEVAMRTVVVGLQTGVLPRRSRLQRRYRRVAVCIKTTTNRHRWEINWRVVARRARAEISRDSRVLPTLSHHRPVNWATLDPSCTHKGGGVDKQRPITKFDTLGSSFAPHTIDHGDGGGVDNLPVCRWRRQMIANHTEFYRLQSHRISYRAWDQRICRFAIILAFQCSQAMQQYWHKMLVATFYFIHKCSMHALHYDTLPSSPTLLNIGSKHTWRHDGRTIRRTVLK